MPLLSKVFSRSSKEKEALEQDIATNSEKHSSSSSPPPTYSNSSAPPYEHVDFDAPPDLSAGFANLKLFPGKSPVPRPDACTAHLKLLESFSRLREDVGSTDGLFGICNSVITTLNGGVESTDTKALSVLAEKRWVVYVSRAVDRFARWRDAVAPATRHMTVPYCDQGGRLEHQVGYDQNPDTVKLDMSNMPPLGTNFLTHIQWHSLTSL